MGTAKITWDASWTQDVTLPGTISDPGNANSAEYTINDTMMIQFAVDIDYGGVYDGPALVYVQRKLSTADFEDQANAHMVVPVNSSTGGASATGRKVFTVGPDVAEFRLQPQNSTGAQISITLHYKKGHIITA